MIGDVATVSLAAAPRGPGRCELCAAEVTDCAAALVVQHPRGGRTTLLACRRCLLAVRRIAAAASGLARFTGLEATAPPDAQPLGRALVERPAAPQLVHQFREPLRGADGRWYAVRVYGGQRPDGTWIGWVQFHALDGSRVLGTGRETTQSSRKHLAYWATGLEPKYLEGAFARARPVRPRRRAAPGRTGWRWGPNGALLGRLSL